ncbi:MAG: DVU0298 family protein [Dehalobacterium sp.]
MNKKQEIYQLLDEGSFDLLLSKFDQEPNTVRKYITMATYAQNEKFRQKAIDFFGFLAEKRAAGQPEYFREIIRRHLWGMNDESGNMDWSAPEIIGAIIAAQPELFKEFASVMIEAALSEPIFKPGLIKAVKMMASKNKELVEYHLPMLGSVDEIFLRL